MLPTTTMPNLMLQHFLIRRWVGIGIATGLGNEYQASAGKWIKGLESVNGNDDVRLDRPLQSLNSPERELVDFGFSGIPANTHPGTAR